MHRQRHPLNAPVHQWCDHNERFPLDMPQSTEIRKSLPWLSDIEYYGHITRRYLLLPLLLLTLAGCSQQQLAAPFRSSVDQELILAAKRGDGVGIWAALASGATPDFTDRSGNTALIFAAREGHADIVELLIGYGVTIDWQDDEKVTPLILASSRNHPEVVTLLLNHGAKLAIKDQWGQTALDYAERRGVDDPIAVMLR